MATMLSLSGRSARAACTMRDDDELLERMKEDDTDAYRELVERHIDRAYGLALRMLKNSADAEDATQDAFVKAWRNRQGWQSGKAKFSTWLYRVVVNRCIDFQRAPRGQWIEDVPEPADEADDAPTALHKRQIYGQLDGAMAQLPARQRAAVALSYYEDLSNGEIAEVLGLSISAVESLLKRGRQGLRALLKQVEGEVRAVL